MSKERIYIVEDERIIAIDLQRRLERLGYQICGISASGEEALSGIRTQLPHLVLMDIVLQGPMDGIEVAVKIRNEFNIPVIFLTAYTDTKTLERAKEASPLGYVLKPFKERELATTIEMALFKSVADNRIREKEELFSAILNSTTDAILVLGKNHEIIFLNPEAEQILEISDSESKTRRLGDLFTLFDMESGEVFQIPLLSGNMKVLKARNLRLTNWKQHSFVVEMTINREISNKIRRPKLHRLVQGHFAPSRDDGHAQVPDQPRYADRAPEPERARAQAELHALAKQASSPRPFPPSSWTSTISR